MMARRVLIIGAGCSGLTAIKQVKDEGLEPVCVERTGDVGGLWHFTEEVRDGQATVMRSTIINTSKEVMSYSDYPIPKEAANYMHNTVILKYFTDYADHFDLKKNIHFHTEVRRVSKAADFDKTGKWDVTLFDKKAEQERKEVFDAILICSGHHASKKMATFPGQDEFQGKIVHAHDYKDQKGYEGKRVVVVGTGNSGMDITAELGRASGTVFLSTRRGAWVTTRVGPNGMPGDFIWQNRWAGFKNNFLPTSWSNYVMEAEANAKFDHEKYGLKPKHRILSQHPSVNDDLPNRILCGSVVVKPNIKRFTKTGVEFEDGTVEDNIEAVVMATGYIFGFPYLDPGIVDVKDNKVDLYKFMFPPHLDHGTIAIIGCIQPLGSIIPASELQCRWAARVFKGTTKLPSKEEMWSEIDARRKANSARYVESTRHTIQVDWLPFMDEIAEQVGCKPNLAQLLVTDPKLAWTVFFGPLSPSQYRLMGPGKWDGARDTVLTVWDRVLYPLNTRKVESSSEEYTHWKIRLMILAVVAVAFIYRFIM